MKKAVSIIFCMLVMLSFGVDAFAQKTRKEILEAKERRFAPHGPLQLVTSEIADYFHSTEMANLENSKATIPGATTTLEELPKIIVNSEGAFVIQTKEVSDQKNSNELFAQNMSVVYPGNLIHVNSQLPSGKPQEVSLPKGKVNLSIKYNLGGGNSTSATVSISQGVVRQQIYNWLNSASAGYSGSVDASSTQKYYTSTSHMAADLNVSVDYLKNSCKVNLKTSSDEMKVVSVQNFCQNFYTVEAEIDADPAKHFGSGVTVAQIKSEIAKYGPIGMITSVTYGRRAYRFREFVSTNFTFKGDESIKANVAGVSASASSTQEVTNSSKTNNIWVFVQGGNQGDGSVFSGDDAENDSNLGKKMSANTKVSSNNPGTILYYSVMFLGNHVQAETVMTDRYYETKYVPCPKYISFEIKKDASQVGGSKISFWVHYKALRITKLDNRGKPVAYEILEKPAISGALPGYVDFGASDFQMGKTRETKTIPTKDCPDKDACYIYGPVYYQLKMNRSAGRSMEIPEEGYINVGGNKAYIYIGGSNYAGSTVYIKDKSTGKDGK